MAVRKNRASASMAAAASLMMTIAQFAGKVVPRPILACGIAAVALLLLHACSDWIFRPKEVPFRLGRFMAALLCIALGIIPFGWWVLQIPDAARAHLIIRQIKPLNPGPSGMPINVYIQNGSQVTASDWRCVRFSRLSDIAESKRNRCCIQ